MVLFLNLHCAMVLLGVWGVDLSLSTLHHDDSTDQLPRLQAALFWANTLRLALWDCSFSFFFFLRPSHEALRSCFPAFFPRNELLLGTRQTSEPLGYNFGCSSTIMIIAEAFWCSSKQRQADKH